jgi:acyl-CoA dehydrogenase
VEEPLARIGAHTYMVEAARRFTALAVDLGEKPSVVSAIIKYHSTERCRVVINDAMDVHGGKGISLGPDNYLGRFYQQMPVAITVEGANILTRTLMIFGQGAIRSHPYVLKEIAAVNDHDRNRALHQFDEALFGHLTFALSNAARSLVFGLSCGRGMATPHGKETRRYYQQLTRFSAAFALSADIAMAVLGGALKRREKISARLGDVLSQLYLCSATLKRFEDEGRPAEDLPLLDWAMQDSLFQIQQAFDGVIRNFPNALMRQLISALVFPLGKNFSPPSDHLGHKVAALLMQPGAARDRLTSGIYIPEDEQDAVGALEAALASTLACEPLQATLQQARKEGKLKALDELLRIAEARDQGSISAEQALQLERDYALRRKVIMVDDFAPEHLRAAVQ